MINKSITLRNYELFEGKRQSWDHKSKMKEEFFPPPQGFEPWSPETKNKWAALYDDKFQKTISPLHPKNNNFFNYPNSIIFTV